MAKTIELKACPLCGAPGKGKRSETSFPHGWVGCPDCGLYIQWVHDARAAVKKWNTRTAPTVSPEEFDPHKTPVGARLDAGLWD